MGEILGSRHSITLCYCIYVTSIRWFHGLDVLRRPLGLSRTRNHGGKCESWWEGTWDRHHGATCSLAFATTLGNLRVVASASQQVGATAQAGKSAGAAYYQQVQSTRLGPALRGSYLWR